jgi:hypothetical protein
MDKIRDNENFEDNSYWKPRTKQWSRPLIAIIILISIFIEIEGQTDSTFTLTHTKKYKREALSIIHYLGIPHRRFHTKDGRLKFAFNKSQKFDGMFMRGIYLYSPPDSTDVIYPTPVVYISRNIYNNLRFGRDTSERHVRASACLLHEITHYYQFVNFNYISYRSSDDYHAYFCQPYEIDAYAVEAFFYLSKQKPTDFKEMLVKYAGNNERLKRELIRLHSRYINRPVLSELWELVCP